MRNQHLINERFCVSLPRLIPSVDWRPFLPGADFNLLNSRQSGWNGIRGHLVTGTGKLEFLKFKRSILGQSCPMSQKFGHACTTVYFSLITGWHIITVKVNRILNSFMSWLSVLFTVSFANYISYLQLFLLTLNLSCVLALYHHSPLSICQSAQSC